MLIAILIVVGLVALFGTLNTTSTRTSAALAGHPVAYRVMPLKASTTYYRGAHMMVVSGILLPLADTSGGTYAGRFFDADITTTAAADGTFTGKVTPPEQERYQNFNCSSADNTWNNQVAVASDDATVALSSSHSVAVGKVFMVLSATKVIIDTADRGAA